MSSPSRPELFSQHAWIRAAFHGDLFAVPVLYRVLIANCIFLLVGALLGTALVLQIPALIRPTIIIGFTIAGLLINIIVNFVLLRIATYSLKRLGETMHAAEKGDMTVRAMISGYDPDADALAATFNLMIARINELSNSRAAQVLSAQEEERRRLARELHDEAGQTLTSLLLNLAVLEKYVNNDEGKQQLDTVREIAHESLRAIRNLSINLRPSSLDELGLLPTLRSYINSYQQQIDIPVAFTIDGLRNRYATEIEITIYRLIQESLTNIARHAKAQHIAIAIREDRHRAFITLIDDGVGFETASLPKNPTTDRGLGLMGMRERVALVGGTIEIRSKPGDGTTLNIMIPLHLAAVRI